MPSQTAQDRIAVLGLGYVGLPLTLALARAGFDVLGFDIHAPVIDALRARGHIVTVAEPWSVGRMWTGIWGILNDQFIPDILPPEAEQVLRALRFDGNRRGKNPPPHWFTTLRDRPRPGPLRDIVVQSVGHLNARPPL